MINQFSEKSGFCGQCGEANPHTAAFCAKCGAPLPWAAPVSVMPPQPRMPPVEATAVPVPPPPPRMPAPPPMAAQAAPAGPLTEPPSALLPQPSISNTTGLGTFVSGLKANLAGKTPLELVRHYAWHLVGLAVLLFLFARFTSTLVLLAALGALVSLFVGLKDPEKFRTLFGAKTSKSSVGWTFGLLFLLLLIVLPNFD